MFRRAMECHGRGGFPLVSESEKVLFGPNGDQQVPCAPTASCSKTEIYYRMEAISNESCELSWVHHIHRGLVRTWLFLQCKHY